MIGTTISHYKILEKLGQGGMGVVYKAHDTSLNRFVALKFLPPYLTQDESIRQRFIVEAQAASALDHPNICTIHEINETSDGQLYICMAYYEGDSLRTKIDKGQISFEEALKIFSQIAQGLNVTHEKNIIHRDIKPANILITQNGDVKIADFGLAKLAGMNLTQSTSSKGTAAYMCPEQIRGQKVDHRCDIWALGVVFYEMLTGHLPFAGDYSEPMMYAIVNEEPQPLSHYLNNAPKALQSIIDKLLAKDIKERYQHVLDVQRDLQPFANEKNSTAIKRRPAVSVPRIRKRTFLYILLAFVVVFLFLVPSRFFLFPSKEINSIAVLPFKNFSNTSEQDYLTDGMTDALITELQKISGLRVISRTSVMHYKNDPKPLGQIAKELNVDVVVEASVQRDEEDVRITTKLMQTTPEQLLWSKEYERHLRDVLTMQKDVASAIASELNINLTPEEKANLAIQKTVNPEAYEDYLQGLYFTRNHWTQQSHQKSIDYFLTAIEKDSSFALAYAGLADMYAASANYALLPPQEALPLAKKYAEKALQLDGTSAEVHTALGFIKMYDWDWVGAEESFKRAIRLNPGFSYAYTNYSWFLAARRRFDESIANANKARDLNPLSLVDKTMYGERLFEAGRYDKAIEQLTLALDSDPEYSYAHWMMGFVYEQKKIYDKAVYHHQKAVEHSGRMTSCVASLGHVYAISGQQEKALNVLEKLLELSKEQYISSYDIAGIYAGLGEFDEAMTWLDKAFEQRDGFLGGFINVDPRWNILRSDKRFINLLKAIGF